MLERMLKVLGQVGPGFIRLTKPGSKMDYWSEHSDKGIK